MERAQCTQGQCLFATGRPGELSIPAIRGVGGGVIYFIDRKSELANVWDVEFRPVADDAPGRNAGLQRFDHIAQTMNYEEMLTWLLFYTAIFETRKLPMVDVVDPGGAGAEPSHRKHRLLACG